ncbi:MAG: hypothetical protein U0228_09195 [Myxococcaceae bacterium]
MSAHYVVQVSADQSSPWKPVFSGELEAARKEFRRVLRKAKGDAAVRIVQPTGEPMMLAFAQPKAVTVAPLAKKKAPAKKKPTARRK